MKRKRHTYFLLLILTIILGLFSRSSYMPTIIYPYLGDYLYAMMFFFIIAFLFPSTKTIKVALISVSLCYLIELLQLYQADWITTIRHTQLGGLVLGFGFLWSDIISYTLAGITACLLEKLFLVRRTSDDELQQ